MPDEQKTLNLVNQLEPLVAEFIVCNTDVPLDSTRNTLIPVELFDKTLMLSQAISLKRIADSMAEVAEHLNIIRSHGMPA